MFKVSATRRIRLKGGTRVHDVVPQSRPMKTACGKTIRLFDARGRVLDRPLSDTTEIAATCRACIRATTTPA